MGLPRLTKLDLIDSTQLFGGDDGFDGGLLLVEVGFR